MKNKTMLVIGVFASIFSSLEVLAQTLTTAETIGKSNKSLFVAGNALIVKEFTTLSYNYAQVVYGISDRIDFYTGVGATTALGQTQSSITGGANVNLCKGVVNVSSFNLISTALNNRNESSLATLFSSVVISKNFPIGKRIVTGYSGYSLFIPLVTEGKEKLFTPQRTVHNIPIGIMVPLGKQALFIEYNIGRQTQMISLGFAFWPWGN